MLHDGVPNDSSTRFEGAAPPAKDDSRISIPIVRPEARNGYKVWAVILSDRVFGVMTHYQARTRPCGHPHHECRFCNAGMPKRWRGYVAAFETKSKAICLIELTPKAANELDEQTTQYTTLRGLVITLEREKPRMNAPCRVTDVEALKTSQVERIPDAFNVPDQLTRIWKMAADGSQSKPRDDEEAPNAETSESLFPNFGNDPKTQEHPTDTTTFDRRQETQETQEIDLTEYGGRKNPTTATDAAPKVYELTADQKSVLAAHRHASAVHSGEDE